MSEQERAREAAMRAAGALDVPCRCYPNERSRSACFECRTAILEAHARSEVARALQAAVEVCERERPEWDKWGSEYRGQREIAAEILANEIRALLQEPEETT